MKTEGNQIVALRWILVVAAVVLVVALIIETIRCFSALISFFLRKIKSLPLFFYAQINLLLASPLFKINFLKTSNYDVYYITNNRIIRIYFLLFLPKSGIRRSTVQILTIGVSTTYCLAALFLSISSEMTMLVCGSYRGRRYALFCSFARGQIIRRHTRMMIQPEFGSPIFSVSCPWERLGTVEVDVYVQFGINYNCGSELGPKL